ncbi:MAG: hypothetical protein PHQ12_03620 [Chthoniobacteraceae bacterium]|nr:hypothetical protein [Chthoniobacteraceae bacterium]
MNTEWNPRIADCIPCGDAGVSRLDLSRRMRGVRFARVRFRSAWPETLCARELRQAAHAATCNPSFPA